MNQKSDKTFYITTPIFYVNSVPHTGHAYTSVLADIIARYHRSLGEETFFLSGTDEHGQKIVRSAEKAGMEPQSFVDKNAKSFQDLYEKLNVSNDAFIRTSDRKAHFPGPEKLWRIFEEKGDIYKDVYQGLYCIGCEKFMSERDLNEEGKCPDHDEFPQVVEEENYFFRISKYQDRVREAIEIDELQILPASKKEEVLGLLKEPLEDISFSRPVGTVPWGIPVPGDPTQMMYVWCDALSNYISALGFGREGDKNFQKFWPADVHIIGKDILRFHAIYWPAMLLSAELPLPKKILVHGFITSGGKKMSKTLGNVIDPNEYVEQYGTDGFRYYLGREVSPFSDGDLTREKFVESYNGNLAHGIGNLFSRTTKMAEKYFNGSVARTSGVSAPLLQDAVGFGEEAPIYHVPYYFEHRVLPEYMEQMDALAVNEAADAVWDFVKVLDGYITDYEPFKLIKTDKEKTELVLWNVLYGLYVLSDLLAPFIPEAAKEIRHSLGAKLGDTPTETTFTVKPPKKPLFQKIESDEA